MPLANSYLDVDGLKAYGLAPDALVDGAHLPPSPPALRAAWRTFVEARLRYWTSEINAKLTKRYAVSLKEPFVETVLGWLAALVTPDLYRKRGWDPSDAQASDLIEQADKVAEKLQEAADAKDGLYELPLRQDTSESGVEKGGPLFYSEADPYTWTDVQAEAIRGR
ncbi:hypothetical protein AKJ09_09851 [Labilithrix luteola]|uniref:Uncharacterized protein n=1 Tax=Labilithrix luteola TaxID=1391654 RepID=A0A0K1QBS5_9BACT|nr:hypothetical protein [Labilithrix luteola]AKV03188.1 hypothetical protein AKJ09_09851 [Labilithrix luteola]